MLPRIVFPLLLCLLVCSTTLSLATEIKVKGTVLRGRIANITPDRLYAINNSRSHDFGLWHPISNQADNIGTSVGQLKG